MVYEVIVNGQPHRLELEKASSGWECRLDGRSIPIDAVMTRRDVISLLIGGHSYEIKCEQTAGDLHVWVGNTPVSYTHLCIWLRLWRFEAFPVLPLPETGNQGVF